jgi:hypothetical protein
MFSIQTVLLSVGGIALVVGVLAALQRMRLLVAGRTAEGVVVERVRGSTIVSRDGKRETLLEPVVEFRHDGKAIRFRSSMGTRDALPVGRRVPVRYLAADPEASAEIASPARMFGLPAVALAAGAVMVAIGLWGPVPGP